MWAHCDSKKRGKAVNLSECQMPLLRRTSRDISGVTGMYEFSESELRQLACCQRAAGELLQNGGWLLWLSSPHGLFPEGAQYPSITDMKLFSVYSQGVKLNTDTASHVQCGDALFILVIWDLKSPLSIWAHSFLKDADQVDPAERDAVMLRCTFHL